MCVPPVPLLRDTLCVHFVVARDAETRRARQKQRRNAVATAADALQARHKETTRLAGEYTGECVKFNFFVEGTAVLCKKIEMSLFGVCTISGILAEVYCLVTYHNVYLLRVTLRLHFVAAKDDGNTASSATAAGKCKCGGGGSFAGSG